MVYNQLGSFDLSQAEKIVSVVKLEQIHKMTISFTQNGQKLSFSAWDKSWHPRANYLNIDVDHHSCHFVSLLSFCQKISQQWLLSQPDSGLTKSESSESVNFIENFGPQGGVQWWFSILRIFHEFNHRIESICHNYFMPGWMVLEYWLGNYVNLGIK